MKVILAGEGALGVDVSMNGIELQGREFFAAIREGEPNCSVAKVLPAYSAPSMIEKSLP